MFNDFSNKKGYLVKDDLVELVRTFSNEVELFEIDNIFNFMNPGTGQILLSQFEDGFK